MTENRATWEIEMKSRVREPGELRHFWERKAGTGREISKRDRYFLPPGGEAGQARSFRLRDEGDLTVLTWKERRKENGLEMNREHETDIRDPAAFLEFIAFLGCEDYFTKEKNGHAWSYEGFTVELCDVPPLGHFLEIEAIVEGDGGTADAEAMKIRERIVALFAECGLGEGDIEHRSYMQMLFEARGPA